MSDPNSPAQPLVAPAITTTRSPKPARIQYLNPSSMKDATIELDPSQIVEEPGLGAGEGLWGKIKGYGQRWVFKNMTSNPQVARAYIESLKGPDGKPAYDVIPTPKSYGADLNLFVRKRGSGGPWRPIDPSWHDPWDVFSDITDLTTDVINGAITGAAYAGGAVLGEGIGGVVAGGVTGMGLEALRQRAGEAMGVPNNINLGQIAATGALTAVVPSVIKGAQGFGSKILPAIGRGVAEYGARVAGVQSAAGMTPGQTMIAKATDKLAGAWGKMPTLQEAADYVRRTVGSIGGYTEDGAPIHFPEKEVKDAIIAQSQATHDFRPIIDTLRDIAAAPTKAGAGQEIMVGGKPVAAASKLGQMISAATGQGAPDETSRDIAKSVAINNKLPAEMKKVLNNIGLVVGDQPEHALDSKTAADVLDVLGKIASDRGAYIERNAGKEAAKVVTRPITAARAQMRQAFISNIAAAGNPEIEQVMNTVDQKTRMLYQMRDAFGLNLNNQQEGQAAARSTIQALYKTDEPLRLVLGDFERLFGLKQGQLVDMVRRYHIGKAVNAAEGMEGVPNWAPRLSMSGLPLGLVAGRFLFTGEPTLAAGTAALASPRIMLGAAQAANQTYGVASKVAEALASRLPASTMPAVAGSMGSAVRVMENATSAEPTAQNPLAPPHRLPQPIQRARRVIRVTP